MSIVLSDKNYVALIPQTSASAPVIPSNFFPLVSESLKADPGISADRRIKGLNWKADEVLQGERKIAGDLVFLADADSLAHIFNMMYLKGSTTGDGTVGYTHPFTVGDGKSYSVEISRGIYAQRTWGVRGDSLKLDFADNNMQATLSIMGLGQFSVASLAVALSGSVTSLVLSTASSPRPSDGLCVGDVIAIGGTNLTLTSVNSDGKTLGFSSTSVTASAGASIFLLAQTPSYLSTLPLTMEETLIGVAATSSAAVTAAAAKSTATPAYNFSLTLKNNSVSAAMWATGGSAGIFAGVREGQVELSTLFTDPTIYKDWIECVKQAITLIAKGAIIKTDGTTSEKLTINLHKVKLTADDQALTAGDYVYDKQTGEVLYDGGDTAAIDITVVDRTAGTAL